MTKAINKTQVFLIIFYLLSLCISFYFSGIVGVVSLFVSLVMYSAIFYTLYYAWKRISKKEYLFYIDFLQYFLSRVAILLIIVITSLGGLSYYENTLNPATMPLVTLSNGVKTVQFQAMIHIGSESFYTQVQDNIRQAKNNGFVLFFEGVKPGTQENMEKFDSALGVNFSPDLYENFGKLYGVTFQDNQSFLNIVNNLDFNVDLSIDDIMTFYDAKKLKSDSSPRFSTEITDINNTIINELSRLNDREMKVLIYINRAILNALIKSDEVQDSILANFWDKNLFDIILNKRNEVVSNEIIQSEYNKIIVTYGLLHFDGILANLKKSDPNWHIVESKNFYPIGQ